MKVELINKPSLQIIVGAIRNCYRSEGVSDSLGDNLGLKDKALIQKIIEFGHTSTLEHLSYTFKIEGISRAVLQELARHRMASLSVESSRYCLKRIVSGDFRGDIVKKTGNNSVDQLISETMERLATILKDEKVPNDIAKYAMPEAVLTSLTWTINARSLANFFKLRSSPKALKEIQELAKSVHNALPESHKFIFENAINL